MALLSLFHENPILTFDTADAKVIGEVSRRRLIFACPIWRLHAEHFVCFFPLTVHASEFIYEIDL